MGDSARKLNTFGTVLCAAASALLILVMLFWISLNVGARNTSSEAAAGNADLMGRYDMFMSNTVSNALSQVVTIKKVYWLSDSDTIAPEPDQSLYGSDDPANLGWLLEDAQELLDGQDTLFSTDTQLFYNNKATYYLDDTIFAVTWKQVIDNCIYTISEVKIAHPSQLRRFFAGNEFGSDVQYHTTDMAESVNAVVASSGDFYKFRNMGVVVYNGVACRAEGEMIDSCYIDDNGDMLFTRRGDMTDLESAQKFVDDNNVRFSFAFGPILVEDYKQCPPDSYIVGEVNDRYSRAAIAQMDELHYLLITANGEMAYAQVPTVKELAARLESFGVRHAYALDGGQTAVIVMNDKLINSVVFGYQRYISDIVYFATAIPDGGTNK